MKSFLTLTAICGIASAIPLWPWSQMAPPPAGTQFYNLQAKSCAVPHPHPPPINPTNAILRATPSINNQWVTLPTSSSSYTLTAAQTSATRFFVLKYNATNTWSFHNADYNRQVALQGQNGTLLYMVDVLLPSAGNIPAGQLMEWATFTMDGSVLGVSDGSTLTSRTFVSAAGGLALYDGKSEILGMREGDRR